MTTPAQIEALLDALKAEITLGFEIDRPAEASGQWWIDLEVGGMPITLSWQADAGFGLFTGAYEDAGIGDRPDELYSESAQTSRRLLQLAAQWRTSSVRPPLGLREVRHLIGETQSDLARSLGTDQAGISRIESRTDWKISTLQEYMAAMGGVLEIRVRFPTFEAPIAPTAPSAAPARTKQKAGHAA
jgi:hypothetical protein